MISQWASVRARRRGASAASRSSRSSSCSPSSALITGGAVRGFRSLAKSDLRAGTAHLSGAIRYLFDRASTTGQVPPPGARPRREGATGPRSPTTSSTCRARPRAPRFDRRRREEEEAKDDEEEKRKAGGRGGDQGSSYGFGLELRRLEARRGGVPPQARALRRLQGDGAQAGDAEEGTSIKIAGVYTPRLTDEVVAGRAYIYFFPLGQTEPAIVHLSDPRATRSTRSSSTPSRAACASTTRRSSRPAASSSTTRGTGSSDEGGPQRGFTLLEVMVALAILASTLVVLLQIITNNVRATHHAKLTTAATLLARGKMIDIEDGSSRTASRPTTRPRTGPSRTRATRTSAGTATSSASSCRPT